MDKPPVVAGSMKVMPTAFKILTLIVLCVCFFNIEIDVRRTTWSYITAMTTWSHMTTVAYLGFHKGGPNVCWPLVLTLRGKTFFPNCFLWWKNLFCSNGGHGPMALLNMPLHDNMVTWQHGHMTTWSHDNMVTWQHGHMTTWSHDNMDTWQHGHMTTWSHDNIVTWQLGLGTGTQNNRKAAEMLPDMGGQVRGAAVG